jgi:uncharacterized protein (TIGR02001 family)
MKCGISTVARSFLGLAALAAVAIDAGAVETSFSADAGLNSRYVWRGILLTDGAVLQPGITFGAEGASVNVWGSMDLADANGMAGEFNEVDYTLDYSFAAGERASVSVGAIAYTFPNTAFESTTELYAGASFDVPGSPSITLYRDVDLIEGLYVSLGGAHSFGESGVKVGFTLGVGDADHNAGCYGGADAGLSDLTLGVTYAFPGLPENQSVSLAAMVTSLAGDPGDVTDAAGGDTSNFVAGVTYSVSF